MKKICLICVISSRSAIGDSFKNICNSLSEENNIYISKSSCYSDNEFTISKEKIFNMAFDKKDFKSYLNIKDWIELRKFIKENQINHLFFYSENPLNIIIKYINFKLPYSFWWHDPITHSGVNKMNSLIYSLTSRNLLKGRKYLQTILASNSLKKLVIKNNKKVKAEKIQVVNLPIMEELSKYYVAKDIKEREYDFIFFGRIEEYKGLDYFYSALNKLEKLNINFKCLIVGAGDINKFFPEKLESVEIINRYVSNEELARYINNSKTAVFPYKDSTATQVIQTSLYFDNRVIATDTGSFREYLTFDGEIYGTIINPCDHNELFNALKKHLEHDYKKLNKDTVIKRFYTKQTSENLYKLLNI